MKYSSFAQYYDLLYRAQGKDCEREACRLHRVIQQYKTSPGNRLLDVGCGTGEHLRYLRAFYQVEGVDSSAEMLHVAQHKLPEVSLYQGDMRTFRLRARFDVVCLFGSIGYVETREGLRQAVANMKRHLVKGGVMVIEPWLGPQEIEDGRTHVVVAEGAECKVVRIGYTRIRGHLSEIRFHFVVADKAGIEQSGLQIFYDPEGLSGRGVYTSFFLS